MSNKKKNNKPLDKISDKAMEIGGQAVGTAGGAVGGGIGGAVAGSVVPGAGTVAGAKLGAKEGAKTGADLGGKIGKEVGKGAGKVASKRSKTLGKFLDNPLDNFIDSILEGLVSFFIPIPILGGKVGEIVAKNKSQIFLFIIGLVLTVSITLFGGTMPGLANNYEGLPPELMDYVEEGFVDSGTPQHSPFGGIGQEKTIITSYFDDPYYYKIYGRWHKALDLVPNGSYYSTNEAYKIYGDVVMFATCSGKAIGKTDQNGANYVVTKCNDGVHETWHLHNKVNFIPSSKEVEIVAGQPVAVMGETGRADGAHIHYVIRKNGVFIDPLPFLNR